MYRNYTLYTTTTYWLALSPAPRISSSYSRIAAARARRASPVARRYPIPFTNRKTDASSTPSAPGSPALTSPEMLARSTPRARSVLCDCSTWGRTLWTGHNSHETNVMHRSPVVNCKLVFSGTMDVGTKNAGCSTLWTANVRWSMQNPPSRSRKTMLSKTRPSATFEPTPHDQLGPERKRKLRTRRAVRRLCAVHPHHAATPLDLPRLDQPPRCPLDRRSERLPFRRLGERQQAADQVKLEEHAREPRVP